MAKRKSKRNRTRRTKVPPAEVLETLRDVDRALLEIAQAEAEAEKVKAIAEGCIRRIRESAARRAAEALEQAKSLRKAVESWSERHRRDFGEDCGLVLPHGRFGWHNVINVAFKVKEAEVVDRLEARGHQDAITFAKRPNKDVLGTFNDETLADLGVRRSGTRDEFFAEATCEASRLIGPPAAFSS